MIKFRTSGLVATAFTLPPHWPKIAMSQDKLWLHFICCNSLLSRTHMVERELTSMHACTPTQLLIINNCKNVLNLKTGYSSVVNLC